MVKIIGALAYEPFYSAPMAMAYWDDDETYGTTQSYPDEGPFHKVARLENLLL